jgi:hypothetical protein
MSFEKKLFIAMIVFAVIAFISFAVCGIAILLML